MLIMFYKRIRPLQIEGETGPFPTCARDALLQGTARQIACLCYTLSGRPWLAQSALLCWIDSMWILSEGPLLIVFWRNLTFWKHTLQGLECPLLKSGCLHFLLMPNKSPQASRLETIPIHKWVLSHCFWKSEGWARHSVFSAQGLRRLIQLTWNARCSSNFFSLLAESRFL